MKIAIGGDHAGYSYKAKLTEYLEKKGYEVEDFGTSSEDSVDYPDYIHPLSKSIEYNKNKLGIIICGSGNGVAMTANKYKGIRAALCWKKEISSLARLHNDANICALPARFISYKKAKKIVDIFLSTAFEGGRHQRRVDKISDCI